jgi:uncharacterized protein (TIGR02265 family)
MRSSRPPPAPSRTSGFWPLRFSTQLEVPFVGDVDLSDVLANIDGQAIKGVFLARYVDEVYDAVHEELISPPSNRTYHAFEWYPMADYVRLFDRAARARFAGSSREAYRLLARSEIEVFGGTTLGKVTFSMVGDPAAALMRYPEVLSLIWKGTSVKAERQGPRQVKISFEGLVGVAVEHVLGAIEGLVLYFDERPVLDVALDEMRRQSFTVKW